MKWKYERMNKELLLVKNLKLIPTRRRTNTIIRDSPESPPKCTLDIYKISRILEERQLIQDEDFKMLELIRRRLPKYYIAFKATFLKLASN